MSVKKIYEPVDDDHCPALRAADGHITFVAAQIPKEEST